MALRVTFIADLTLYLFAIALVDGRPLYCEEITACKGQIATTLVVPPVPPVPQVGGEDTTGAGGAGSSQQDNKLRK